MKLIFREDIDNDVWNWQNAVNASSHGIDWKRFLPTSITAEEVGDNEFLKKYLEKEFYAPGKVSGFREWLESNVHADQIESDLTALMRQPFLSDTITIYLTTFNRAPYDVQKSSILLFEGNQKKAHAVTTIYHELMHFLFHWHYWKECIEAGLSDSATDELKESLTVLLNPILEKRGLSPDQGYPIHEKLRTQWASLYEENPNFQAFLKKAIVLYKESLVN